MYQVDTQDAVVELVDVPAPDAGAPLPAVVAAEHELQLIYLASEPDPEWDGTYARVHSSWLRGLERMNSVHQYHTAARFAGFRHFIFAFHDSTFECIAKSYTCELRRGSVASVAAMAPQTW